MDHEGESQGFKITELSEVDSAKVKKDLEIIDLSVSFVQEKGYRAIVAGGYAVDAFLGKITRPHNDIDLQLFSQNSDPFEIVNALVAKIKGEKPGISDLKLTYKERRTYYHSILLEGKGIGIDIVYVQVTTDPFTEDKIVVKNDGSFSPSHKYETHLVNFQGIEFEAQLPIVELADKIQKRQKGAPTRDKHTQDIENLRSFVKADELAKRLLNNG